MPGDPAGISGTARPRVRMRCGMARTRPGRRWLVEAMFCRLKDVRCAAIRYVKLVANFLSAAELVAVGAFRA